MKQETDWHNQELERSDDDYARKLKEAGAEFVPVDRQAFLLLAKEKIPSQFKGIWKDGLYKGETRQHLEMF